MRSVQIKKIKSIVQNALHNLGLTVNLNSSLSNYTLVANSELDRLRSYEKFSMLLNFLSVSEVTANLTVTQASHLIRKSKSQLGQDVLALSYVGIQKPGYFVEFGATNGLDLSNTYMLEKNYGWKGILCEPARIWHKDLLSNRKSIIDTRCVYKSSNESISFSESATSYLSTVTEFVKSDPHPQKITQTYEVKTVTLNDLLEDHNAPNYIDFISIDTEGSEYLILQDFDFDRHQFGLICIEHNFTENREKIFDLLSLNGYQRVFEEFSMWDDWYVKVG
jgi:FkbM family methyltransferase